MYMSIESLDQQQQLTEEQITEGLEELSLNANLAELEISEKSLMKTFLQSEMNEFFQDMIDNGSQFDDVDEENKAKFIGNFFMWVKKEFKTEKGKKRQEWTLKPANQQAKIKEQQGGLATYKKKPEKKQKL